MPEYLTPGVYIEEIERGPRPIEGVPTSTSAFLGETERGPVRPKLVTSYKEFERNFGGVFHREKFMPYAVNGFFENGGRRLYVCRIVGENATPAELDAGDFVVRAAGPGSWGLRLWVRISPSTTRGPTGAAIGFRLRLAYFAPGQAIVDPFPDVGRAPGLPPAMVEDFDDLVADERSPDFFGKRLQFIDLAKGNTNEGPESSALAMLVRKAGVAAGAIPGMVSAQLAAGGADDPNLGPDDYVGAKTAVRQVEQGLTALTLDPYREVALVYAPAVESDVYMQVVTHCESNRFRFAAIDAPKNRANAGELDPRSGPPPVAPVDTSYASFYYPWIVISDPSSGARKVVPPGGYMLGIYARTDAERGVFKAPANETVRGALDLEYDINDNTQGVLNPRGVNVIRRFPGRGIRIWGARTLSSNGLWRYTSVRRLFIFLERSIYEGTQWVVFEPNDDRLWARVTDTVRLFLRGQWRLGALFGRTEQEAFFITCDRSTMTQDDILNGRLICEIGIAPVRPAEFVVFRIFQHTAEAQR